MDRSITTARNPVIAEINKDLKTIKIKQYVAFNDFSPFWSRWEIDQVFSLFGYKSAITDKIQTVYPFKDFLIFLKTQVSGREAW